MTEFFCFPVCKNCIDSNSCVKMLPKMESVPADEYIRTRAPRETKIASAYLPCGCFGLPWPIVGTFGSNISEVLCETHGWVKVKKGYKFSSELPKPKTKKWEESPGDTIPFLS